MFAIKVMVNREFDGYLLDANDEKRLWADPQEAKTYADECNRFAKQHDLGERYLIEHQPQDNDWRHRELMRLVRGEYKRHFFANFSYYLQSDYNGLHYLHVSTDDPEKVAFTPSEEYGRINRQKRMKFTRYLDKYFADTIPSDEREYIIKSHYNEYVPSDIHFAWTEDEIEWVYTHGPPSCMSRPVTDFDLPCHPVRAYAAGDLAIAYKLSPHRHNTVQARVVVWPDKKIYGRIYGDDMSIRQNLINAGYREDCFGFEGAKLLAIEHDGEYIAPYLDVNCRGYIENGYIVLDDTAGKIRLRNDSGLQAPRTACNNCNDYVHEIELCAVSDDMGEEMLWCRDCAIDDAFNCDQCDYLFTESASTRTAEDNIICNECAEGMDECAECQRPTRVPTPDPRNHDHTICEHCESDIAHEAENNTDHHTPELSHA